MNNSDVFVRRTTLRDEPHWQPEQIKKARLKAVGRVEMASQNKEGKPAKSDEQKMTSKKRRVADWNRGKEGGSPSSELP